MHRYFADTKDAKHFALAEPVDDNASGPDASFFSSLAKQFGKKDLKMLLKSEYHQRGSFGWIAL